MNLSNSKIKIARRTIGAKDFYSLQNINTSDIVLNLYSPSIATCKYIMLYDNLLNMCPRMLFQENVENVEFQEI